MANNIINFNMRIEFKDKEYKRFLKKLSGISKSFASIGIHSQDGQKPVVRKYVTGHNEYSAGVVHRAGITSQFNIAKLAYQNEYGADIPIKAKFRVRSKPTKSGAIISTVKKQGYVLRDKNGKFIAYFPVGHVIKIPARRFMHNAVVRPEQKYMDKALFYAQNYLLFGSASLTTTWKMMGRQVELNIRKKIYNSTPPNHPLTVKAKGFNRPLIEEQKRLINNIKTEVYVSSNKLSNMAMLDKRTANIAEKLYKSSIFTDFTI